MSRSLHQSRGRKRSSCACGRCSGFKAQPRALDVAGDLAANDEYVPSANEYDDCGVCPWDGPCPHCDLPPIVESEPGTRPALRAPLAEIARVA